MRFPILAVISATSLLQAQHVPGRPCDNCVPGLINFAKLSPALWRGAQPQAESFQAMERMGLRTVVSFRSSHDDFALLKGTKLKYLRISSHAGHPEDEDIAAFLRVMQDPANHPVFIHCAQGRDRTGVNAAAYRRVFEGWSAEEALTELNAFHFNKVWITVPHYIRKMDPAALKARAEALPAPIFQCWTKEPLGKTEP